jgi:hypothetical protein
MDESRKITGTENVADAARREAWTRDMMRKIEELHAEMLRRWPDWPNEVESDDEG